MIYPLYGDATALSTLDLSTLQGLIRGQIDEVGNHPGKLLPTKIVFLLIGYDFLAIIMYTLGNELGMMSESTSFVNNLNSLFAYARGYSLYKWNRFIPITSAIVDLPSSYVPLFQMMDVDVFTTNAG